MVEPSRPVISLKREAARPAKATCAILLPLNARVKTSTVELLPVPDAPVITPTLLYSNIFAPFICSSVNVQPLSLSISCTTSSIG